MIPVILSAGRGSRVGERTKQFPKWFLDVGEKRICDYQLSALAYYFDSAYVVLGHGFTDGDDPKAIIPDRDDIDVESLVYPDWDETENAGTASYALDKVPDDDLLLICGDVIFSEEIVSMVIDTFEQECGPAEFSAVAAFEGIQDEKTAVLWDDRGRITDYGKVRGHEEAGIFVLHEAHSDAASAVWSDNPHEWFPIIFPKVKTKAIRIPQEQHFEINTEQDLLDAESSLVERH